jgi:hypothetical protein
MVSNFSDLDRPSENSVLHSHMKISSVVTLQKYSLLKLKVEN